MVHHGQRLPLGLEPRHHFACVHAGLDDLQRHFAADGLPLRRHVHNAHAPFANLLQQLVGTDLGAGEFEVRQFNGGGDNIGNIQQTLRGRVLPQQCPNVGTKFRIISADSIQIHFPLIRRIDLDCRQKDRSFVRLPISHCLLPPGEAEPSYKAMRRFGKVRATK